ncbi:MAG: hypothetical protein JW904_12260 [Spirochaetales bacterium]|nr:hypothetical protein [Spirochaetales bacterium]
MRKRADYSIEDLCLVLEHLKKSLRIAVIFGGDKSKEKAVRYQTSNPRSWKSYESVAYDIANALSELGFQNVFVMPDDMSLLPNLEVMDIHLAWLNTGGVQGYIPTAHASAMLEMAGVPYIGHNPMNAAILDNKHIFKTMLQKFNIKTAPFLVWSRSALEANAAKDTSEIHAVFGDYTGPFIVKPTSGRASLHVTYVPSVNDLFDAVNEVYEATQNLVVIEKYVGGSEYCVSITGPVISKKGDCQLLNHPFAFSHVRRNLAADEPVFTSMDKKPITNERITVLGDGNSEKVVESLSKLAHSIYTSFFLETLVRIDIRADEAGELFVLETNPKPDLKKPAGEVTSLTCIGLAQKEMSYNDLIMSLFADRLDYLLSYRSKNITHITSLVSLSGVSR